MIRYAVVHRDSKIGKTIRANKIIVCTDPSYDLETFCSLPVAINKATADNLLVVRVKLLRRKDKWNAHYWKIMPYDYVDDFNFFGILIVILAVIFLGFSMFILRK